MENELNVYATKLTINKIYYECPFCYTSSSGYSHNTNLTKNGKIIKSRKPTIHHHGNCASRSSDPYKNRKTIRSSHCLYSDGRSVNIIINDATIRA